MGNCIVTKLNVAIADDSLLRLDEVKLKVFNGKPLCIGNNVYPQTIRCLDGTTLNGDSSYSKTTVWTPEIPVIVTNASGIGAVVVPDKDSLIAPLGIVLQTEEDLNNIRRLPNVEQIRMVPTNLYDHINFTLADYVSLSNKTTILHRIIDKNTTGDLTDFLPLKDTLQKIKYNSDTPSITNNYTITGNFTDYGHLHKLVELDLWSRVKNTVAGSLEDFVRIRLTEQPNPTSVDNYINIRWIKSDNKISFNGTVLGNDSSVPNYEKNVVSWDAEGNITLEVYSDATTIAKTITGHI